MSNDKLLILLHQSKLREVAESEALAVLSAEESAMPREIMRIDMSRFDEDVEGGGWTRGGTYLRSEAQRIRELADRGGFTRILHFGIAEVPYLVAFGAYLEDARPLEAFDYERDKNTWTWPTDEQTLHVDVLRSPKELVTATGHAVLRVEVSYPISDSDVTSAVGQNPLCDVRVCLANGEAAIPGVVKSRKDVEAIRMAVRQVLGAILEFRPQTEVIHLFISAPVSVCLAVGQELRLRNGRDVQTYRYRKVPGDDAYKPAVFLSTRDSEASEPLSPEQTALAAELRAVLRDALHDVWTYAETKRKEFGGAVSWYETLLPHTRIRDVAPFPDLSPLWHQLSEGHKVSDEGRPVEYAFPKDSLAWEFSDMLVLNLYRAANEDKNRMRALCRLFFFHETLHDWQGLTKYNARGVGRFFNCLERIDYMADSYALLHQLDYEGSQGNLSKDSDADQRNFLWDQMGLLIASLWAFASPPPQYVWQERALRRYMNWYWRRVQLQRTSTLDVALRLFQHEPKIEIAGFERRLEGARVNVVLNRPRPGDQPEIGLVLEDGRFQRRGSHTVLSIEHLMRAFAEQDVAAIDSFFNALFDEMKATGSVTPRALA